jgi:hypothetical protein
MKALNYLSIITVANLMISSVFSLAGIFSPSSLLPAGMPVNSSTIVFALYAAVRAIPLAIVALFAIRMRDKKPILILAVLAGIIQFSDGFIGLYQRDLSKVIGPFVLAALTFIGIFMNWRTINADESNA